MKTNSPKETINLINGLNHIYFQVNYSDILNPLSLLLMAFLTVYIEHTGEKTLILRLFQITYVILPLKGLISLKTMAVLSLRSTITVQCWTLFSTHRLFLTWATDTWVCCCCWVSCCCRSWSWWWTDSGVPAGSWLPEGSSIFGEANRMEASSENCRRGERMRNDEIHKYAFPTIQWYQMMFNMALKKIITPENHLGIFFKVILKN